MVERWEAIRDESPRWPGSGYTPEVQIEALSKGVAERDKRIAELEAALEAQWDRWNSMSSQRTRNDGGEVVRVAMREIRDVLATDPAPKEEA